METIITIATAAEGEGEASNRKERIGNATYESTATSTLHECAFRNYKYTIRRRFALVLTSPFPPLST